MSPRALRYGFSILEMVVVVALVSALALAANATFDNVSDRSDQEAARLRLSSVLVELTRASGTDAVAGYTCGVAGETAAKNRYFESGLPRFGSSDKSGYYDIGDLKFQIVGTGNATLASSAADPDVEASAGPVDIGCVPGADRYAVGAVMRTKGDDGTDRCLVVVSSVTLEAWGLFERPDVGCRADFTGIVPWARQATGTSCPASNPCVV